MQLGGKAPSFNQIRYFVAVAKYLNFRQAAGALGISQPTLTSQINALEDTLNLTLFERSRTGTLLSPQGKALLASAEEVLQSTQRFTEMARDLSKGEIITYRLGIPPTLGPYLLPFVLPDLHKLKPGLRFYVREASPDDLQHGLLRGEYDLILSPLSTENSQLITYPAKPSCTHRISVVKKYLRWKIDIISIIRYSEYAKILVQIYSVITKERA